MLERGAVPVAKLTAEVLLGHALHQSRSWLYAHAGDVLPERAWIHYGRYLEERLRGKPTQYITHLQEFFGREFFVDENVLIPRPETEHLVEAAIEYVRTADPQGIIDVGTGSGAIAISVALETRQTVFASDISAGALSVAERNRKAHDATVRFFAGDLLQAVRPQSIDLLLSNPPYVPGSDAANMQQEVRDWEPHVALFAGDTGLEIYRDLLSQAQAVVKPGGVAMFELGYRSLAGVRDMLTPQWSEVEAINDLAGWTRVLVLRRR